MRRHFFFFFGRAVCAAAVLSVLLACDNWNIPVKDRIEWNLAITPVTSQRDLEAVLADPRADLIAVVEGFELEGQLYVDRPLAITTYSGRQTIKRKAGFTASFFTVSGGGSLTLGHPGGGTLVLDGGGDEGITGADPLIKGEAGSSITIKDGAELRNNHAQYPDRGGAVCIENGSLAMEGGLISGNTAGNGGGVSVTVTADSSAAFTMSGGTISGNTSGPCGGGVVVEASGANSSATFTLAGGTISGNTSTNGGGVYVYAYGADSSAEFTMLGGTISGNSGHGGGVGVAASGADRSAGFAMGGGTISGNTSSSNGGGVVLSGAATLKKTPVPPATTSGVIYGSDAAAGLKNTAPVTDTGHAVYAGSKKRDTTAGETDTLDSTVEGPEGGWD